MPKAINKKSLWIIIILALLLAAIYLVFLNRSMNNASAPNVQEPVACTMDAKICADGSAVGRSGPNCEFAAFPFE